MEFGKKKTKYKKKIKCDGIRNKINDPFFGHYCGQTLGYLTDEGFEIKCPRCKKIVLIRNKKYKGNDSKNNLNRNRR